MPEFVYRPEGVEEKDAKRWPWLPGKLVNAEATEIERVTGMRFGVWREEMEGPLSMRATAGFLYVLLKRDNPTLRFDQVAFTPDEVSFVLSDEEKRTSVATLVKLRDTRGLGSAEQAYLDDLIAAVGLPDPAETTEDPEGEANPPNPGGAKPAPKKKPAKKTAARGSTSSG